MVDNGTVAANVAATSTGNNLFQIPGLEPPAAPGPLSPELTPNTAATTNTTSGNTSPSTPSQSVSNGDLPWAIVALPTDSAGHSGSGWNKHGLLPETWVIGFFADGDSCQQPVIIGVLSGSQGGAYTSGGNSGKGDGTGGTTPAAANVEKYTGGKNLLVGNTKAEQAYNFFISKGYTHEQAAGIIGNLAVETGHFTAGMTPGKMTDKGIGWGVAQWNGDRLARLRARYGSQWPSYEEQLDFIDWELKNTHGRAYSMLKNARDPAAAAEAFCNFEQPLGHTWKTGCAKVPSIEYRIQDAFKAYKTFKK